MSGFAGILNLDGTPVDRLLLERMTRSLAFRGPDAQEILCDEGVGLCHALLRTTHESARERQPATFEGRLLIVADARIDARAELIEKLNTARGNHAKVSLPVPDCELILHAYDVWQEACLDHLIGDFSFAIWDARRRRLFCARDHFGVKLLYYARIGNALLFSNNLDTLRLHPQFSPRLCDLAIGDYLLIGANLHATRTPFEQILRLPPAHNLVVSGTDTRVSRYWSFPIEDPLRYRRSGEYVEQFHRLAGAAIEDRLRTDRASISLSGGLDSPTVAALATEQLGAAGSLLGLTYGFKRTFADPEPGYARKVAEYLRIPFEFIAIDSYKPFERCNSPALHYPWPMDVTLAAPMCDFYDLAAKHGRVHLTGVGGDPGLVPSLRSYRGHISNLCWDVGKYILTHGHHPRLGFRIAWQRWRGVPSRKMPGYPVWLNPDFESRAGLQERWRELMQPVSSAHPARPDSHASLAVTHWSSVFETYEPGCTHVPVEVRHPLFDLRLQRFFLRLPVLPWCADKEILRVALRGRLPREILQRPKAPVIGNSLAGILREADTERLNAFAPERSFERYVLREKIPAFGPDAKLTAPNIDLRPINLNYWLSYAS